MPPPASKGFFGNLWDQVRQWVAWAEALIGAIIDQTELILQAKELVETDLAQALEAIRTATEVADDLEEKIKTLKKRVIRADLIYQLIDDLRTGALKDLFVDDLQTVKDDISGFLSDASAAISNASPSITKSKSNVILDILHKVFQVWAVLGRIAQFLQKVQPVIQDITDLLKKIDDIILEQNRPKLKVPDKGFHYSRRG